MVPDVASTTEIHRSLAEKRLLPAEHIVDTGYNDAALLVSSAQQYGITLTVQCGRIAAGKLKPTRDTI
jgi:hypothetical protein